MEGLLVHELALRRLKQDQSKKLRIVQLQDQRLIHLQEELQRARHRIELTFDLMFPQDQQIQRINRKTEAEEIAFLLEQIEMEDLPFLFQVDRRKDLRVVHQKVPQVADLQEVPVIQEDQAVEDIK